MAIDQIEQKEKEDPDDIDEVPVQSSDIDRGEILGRVCTSSGLPKEKRKNTHTDNHVERVQPRHGEVKGEKQFRRALQRRAFEVEGDLAGHVVFHILLVPLVRLHAQEDTTEDQGEDQKEND